MKAEVCEWREGSPGTERRGRRRGMKPKDALGRGFGLSTTSGLPSQTLAPMFLGQEPHLSRGEWCVGTWTLTQADSPWGSSLSSKPECPRHPHNTINVLECQVVGS